jgi:histidyl-tRNA synthetase
LNSRIEFDYDNRLVRGLDYYTGIIFELKNKEGKAMLGGGRYDNLYKKIDKFSNFPSIGFAFGIERLIDYVIENREISIWNELNKKSLEILIIFYELDD